MNMPAVFPVTAHTQYVGPGSTFVAIKGFSRDGLDYIIPAIHAGATTVVVDVQAQLTCQIEQALIDYNVQLKRVDNTRRALSSLSAQAAGYPAQKLKIIGVTGTKGKTTSVYLLEHIYRQLGYKVARMSTVKNKIGDYEFPPSLTTPQPDYLHQFLALCVSSGTQIVIMEIAAQALSLDRVADITLDAALFTNFDMEHGEFYSTLDDYFKAKAQIVHLLKPSAQLVGSHDFHWVSKVLQHSKCTRTYTATNDMNAVVRVVTTQPINTNPIMLTINVEGAEYTIDCPSLVGMHNIYNVIGVITLVSGLGHEVDKIIDGLRSFKSVPGRMERYQLPDNITAIIDYAHNPSSFASLFTTVRLLTPHLIVVFGAGGGRDKLKRPVMGALAAQYADIVILTNDNPRTEDPMAIVQDIMAGIGAQDHKKVTIELDRERAIRYAHTLCQPGSFLLLLGKGPDEYQIMGDCKIDFSEVEIIKQLTLL
ncbi:UDP-N-acetylmuramoyl-L-alanyl-D-glutamate--2,6-diaminopimelate ligase [Vermiphilus pyriformis]|nr:MAG: UDP-N-acetylmuramoyl-L-alanyl-D-glutamate--2,6-diaminopimelate ligase [Vermiphilus pyriformis]